MYEPKLPTEVWLFIFTEVMVVVPEMDLEFRSQSPFDAPVIWWERQKLSHRRSVQNGRALILVSRTWYHLALPLLYQMVSARGVKELATLQHSLSNNSSNPKQYIKHLFLITADHGRIEDCDTHPWLQLPSFPRLVELQMIDTTESVPNPSIHFLDTYGANLSSLVLCLPHQIIEPSILYYGLSSAPNLRRLYLNITLKDRLPAISQSLSFPFMHTLSLNTEIDTIADHWELPSLEHLCGIGAFVTLPHSFHAPNVQVLTWTVCVENHHIVDAFPLVEDAVFYTNWSIYTDRPVPFRRIRLMLSDLLLLRDHFIMLNNTVTYPRLAVIRLNTLRDETCESPLELGTTRRVLSFWHYWIKRFLLRGVRLEDSKGVTITSNNLAFAETATKDYNMYWRHHKTTGEVFDFNEESPPSHSDEDDSNEDDNDEDDEDEGDSDKDLGDSHEWNNRDWDHYYWEHDDCDERKQALHDLDEQERELEREYYWENQHWEYDEWEKHEREKDDWEYEIAMTMME